MVVVLCAFAVIGCGSSTPAATPSPVIARVASQPITLAQFNVRYQTTVVSIAQAGGKPNPAQTTAVRTSVLRSLIIDAVIREEAAKLGLAATPR